MKTKIINYLLSFFSVVFTIVFLEFFLSHYLIEKTPLKFHFALPAALGAKMGVPEREVIAIMGDGSLQMNIQEMGTVFQTQAAVKMVVLNNEFLGMVRQWQELFFDRRYASTIMTNPDFITIAKGYHFETKLVTKREELAAAVAEMVASKKSYLLEVRVEKEDNVFPMIPSGASVSDIRLK